MINRILYKNIYCALCNGISSNLEHKRERGKPWHEYTPHERDVTGGNKINMSLDIVEWLPATIECSHEKIKDYVEMIPTHSKLVELIRR